MKKSNTIEKKLKKNTTQRDRNYILNMEDLEKIKIVVNDNIYYFNCFYKINLSFILFPAKLPLFIWLQYLSPPEL